MKSPGLGTRQLRPMLIGPLRKKLLLFGGDLLGADVVADAVGIDAVSHGGRFLVEIPQQQFTLSDLILVFQFNHPSSFVPNRSNRAEHSSI